MRFRRIFRVRPQQIQLYDVPETSQDSYGQTSTAGTLIGTFWATVEPLKGDEQLNVRQIWPTATHTVRMRWQGSAIPAGNNRSAGQVQERMYLVVLLDNKKLNVVNAKNVEERNQFWELTCEEKRDL